MCEIKQIKQFTNCGANYVFTLYVICTLVLFMLMTTHEYSTMSSASLLASRDLKNNCSGIWKQKQYIPVTTSEVKTMKFNTV